MELVFLLGHGDAEPQLAHRQALVVAAAAVGLLLAHRPQRDELQPTLAAVAVVGDALQDVVVLLLLARAFVGELGQDWVVLVFDHLYRPVYRNLLSDRFYVVLGLLQSHPLFRVHLHHPFKQSGQVLRVNFLELPEVLF